MTERKCACSQFERLEGASVPAYIKAFLEQVGESEGKSKDFYRCRVCQSEWERRAPETKNEGTRPSLVRVG
jgi:NAD dependent epimerase/dehydratase family enzyme